MEPVGLPSRHTIKDNDFPLFLMEWLVVQPGGRGPQESSSHPQLTVDRLNLAQAQGRQLLMWGSDAVVSQDQKTHVTVLFSCLQALRFLGTPLPPCPLSLGGNSVSVLFRAEHTTDTCSQHLGHESLH